MDAVEAIGLVKMDLLAQGGLAALRDVKIMLDRRGIAADPDRCVARDTKRMIIMKLTALRPSLLLFLVSAAAAQAATEEKLHQQVLRPTGRQDRGRGGLRFH